ncbi:MAG: adenine-specific methylase [Chitinophagaceae bacterium]|nr:adenine-specific methylase [Chitinophagaceae bacterium]
MPSRHTFQIKPIQLLLQKYVGDGIGWIDPFAGENSPAEITNDMNPDKPAKFHLHAKEFAAQLTGEYRGVLFDPPYSLRQVKECYDKIGVKLFQEDTQRFPQNVKELIAPKIKLGGTAITFGWNSQGFGKNLGFEIIEILLVPHGRGHNDTIVTVERKFKN